jgi:acyl-coenzyme A synthetase/AMP-(fatty) acid ligase
VPDISKTRVNTSRSLKLERDLNRPFFWLYSGGATDRPSLWSKTPLNLLGEALFLSDHFHITPQDLFLASVPPQHIYGLLFSILLPFVSRARVVNDTLYFPGEIVTKADNVRATVFIGSPMHYKALAARLFHLDTVRLAFSSGGFLEEAHSLAFSEKTRAPVEEVYGSTETGGIASRGRWHGEDAWKPFPVVEWKTRDERLLLQSPFISPELSKDAEGYFMTGDRVGVCNDGRSFDLYGRADRVVKVGGNRVDLGAVEEKLKTHTGVMDVYVFQVAVQSGRENEIAALMIYDGTLKSLKETMRETLSPFEIPRHILKVTAIPSTGTGKRDREAALSMVVDQKG